METIMRTWTKLELDQTLRFGLDKNENWIAFFGGGNNPKKFNKYHVFWLDVSIFNIYEKGVTLKWSFVKVRPVVKAFDGWN